MLEEQIKPLSVKLIVTVNINNYKAALAKNYNVKPEEVEVIIEDYKEEAKEEKNTNIFGTISYPENASRGEVVGTLGKHPVEEPFLKRYIRERKMSETDVAISCSLSLNTIRRACDGFRIRQESFERISNGLKFTADEKKAFEKSLYKKQRDWLCDVPQEEIKRSFLAEFMESHKLTNGEMVALCGVSEPTIKRMKAGFRVENPTFDKVVHGLGLTAEEATALRNSLTKRQRGYTK